MPDPKQLLESMKIAVAQWLAHAVIASSDAGSILDRFVRFFLCSVAMPESYGRL